MRKWSAVLMIGAALLWAGAQQVRADDAVVLSGNDLAKVVPAGFYFEGRSGPTQMRNAGAVRFGANRHLIAALVDTSGYSSDVQAKYEGFLISDSKVKLGDTELSVGAYGFSFTKDGKMNILDLAGSTLHVLSAMRDDAIRTPQPLTVRKEGGELRLYRGRSYVVITHK
ncbi:MAG: hypothetical protein AB1898_00185 [Acidobacteriota bacterium]